MSSTAGSKQKKPAGEAPSRPHQFATTALGPADVRDTPYTSPPVPEDDYDPWIGRTLSNVYEIEARIGEGGMGTVYLARHVHLQKSFAIKVLADTASRKTSAVDRLRQEAMAAANIDHENIVEVVNFDRTEDGSVFIVMELLKGEDLADCIARGPVELHRALPIAYQICRALHTAHEHSIVHRDLKPENVFLTQKGSRTLVKVLDFGISKIKSAEAEQVRITQTGQLIGTPLYMSPEQARGESEIDRRIDVYAMGVILYEMLTGAPPFDGRNYFELLWKHGNEPAPSLKHRNPNVYIPDAIEEVVLRALAKDRDERYQTMEELEHALIAAAPDVPTSAPSLPPDRVSIKPVIERAAQTTESVRLPTRRTWPWIAGIAAVLVLCVIGVALLSSKDDPPRRVPIARPAPRQPAPAPEPPALEAPVPAPISVALSSLPSGAHVRAGDRVLGTTPIVATLPASNEALRLTFSMDGYVDRTVSVTPTEGLTVPTQRLRRRARPTSGRGTDLPIKTGL